MIGQSPVVYWLGHPTLVRAMAGSNPIRNPLLPAKAVERQLSDDRFERTPTGFRTLMVLNYVVLGSGPAYLGTA